MNGVLASLPQSLLLFAIESDAMLRCLFFSRRNTSFRLASALMKFFL